MMLDRIFGSYEYWKTHFFVNFVQSGMTILDIGANIGYYSLLSARLMGDDGRILAFEPDPESCKWLHRSIEFNRYQSVQVFQCALSDRDGTTQFYPGKKSGWGSLFERPGAVSEDREPFTITMRSLDTLLEELKIRNVDLIKIDVEGSELLVLKGAERMLARTSSAIVLDIDPYMQLEDRRELRDLLSRNGFQLFRMGQISTRANLSEPIKDICALKSR